MSKQTEILEFSDADLVRRLCGPNHANLALIEEAFAEADMERRTRLTRQIMAYGHEQAQGLFLYEAANLTALGPKVSDYRTEGSFVLYEAVRKAE